MLNKALLLASGKKKGTPSFTLDLTTVSDSKLGENNYFCYDGKFNTVIAETSYTIENSRLDYVDMQSTIVLELYVGKNQQTMPTLEMVNVEYWTESAASSANFWTYYFAPDDLTKDAYVKITYP